MRHGAKIAAGGALILAIGLAGLGFGGWLLWLAATSSSNRVFTELTCIGGVLLVVFGAALGLFGIGTLLSGLTAIAIDVQWDVQPKMARLGETLNVKATITPHRPVLVGPGHVRLVKREHLSYWVRSLLSKTQRRKEEDTAETIVQEVMLLSHAVEQPPGVPLRLSARLRVPPEEMATFQREETSPLGKDTHRVSWQVTLDLPLRSWPDAYKAVDVRILPVSTASLAMTNQTGSSVVRGPLSEPLYLTLAQTSLCVGDVLSGTVHWGGSDEADVWVSAGYRIVAEARTWTTIIGQANFRLAAGGQAPFAFAIPAEGPLSYKGKLFAIRWFVLAQAGEKQQEMEVRVRAREETPPISLS
jgi:hypothetical protein